MGWLLKIGSKFTGMSTIRIVFLSVTLTAAIVGSAAFIAGARWEKAERYDEALLEIQKIEDQAVQSLEKLNAQWAIEARKAQIQVEEWNLQNRADEELFDRLLNGQSIIRSRFNDLEKEVFITNDFGTCQLSPDAIRLLRQASDAANSGMPES